ncbi:tyrosine-type recombinase/integrase [Halocatena marina]|uniref:Tyrosine-type recombinase/integrase n=1 Tax=Halocatena marina TaxID=2934937 RepID=A0ABD5YTN7_9EURY|nr:integrase [Halocatena marina]
MSALTPQSLDDAIKRYLRSKSKGGPDSGTYQQAARTALTRWREWLSAEAVDRLEDPDDGARVMRRYAQHLTERVGEDELAASSAQTYYNIVSGFCSYCVRDGVLPSNPALRDRAREELPTDDSDGRQQFWDPETRDRFLRWIDDRAYEAIDADGRAARLEARDRAFVYLLAYSGVRGAEILRTSADEREGRQGLRWRNVTLPDPDADADSGTLRVFGKAQEWETTPLPRQAVFAVRQYYALLDEPSGEWPVFPTEHAPSKYRVARNALKTTHELAEDTIETLLEGTPIDRVLREYEITPPAVTVNGMRSHMQTLCEQADIDIDGEYLKLHGARRGLGDTVFRVDRGEAQDLLRHRSLQTTKDAYSHIAAEERAERVSDILDNSE